MSYVFVLLFLPPCAYFGAIFLSSILGEQFLEPSFSCTFFGAVFNKFVYRS